MYVFHLPVLFYLGLNDAATHGTKVPILQVAIAFGVTLGLSILSYYLLENPMAKLKQNFSGTRPVEPVGTKGANVTQSGLSRRVCPRSVFLPGGSRQSRPTSLRSRRRSGQEFVAVG